MEGMFKDIELSSNLMNQFKQSEFSEKIGSIDLSVNVLTQTFWPSAATSIDCSVPPSLGDCLEIFKSFYQSKHSGRRLTWQHAMGTCLVKANFQKGRKELQRSQLQAVVLLLFNS